MMGVHILNALCIPAFFMIVALIAAITMNVYKGR